MAKFVYTNAKEDFAKKQISWTADTIKCLMVKSGYAQSASDLHLDTITAGNRVGTAQTITTPTATGGVCKCDASTFTSVAGGSTVVAFVYYKDTGVEATSDLIAYIGEDSGGTPFSIATNGSNIVFTPNASGVFAF